MSPLNAKERGGALVEFVLAGIPLVLMLTSMVQLSLAMWNYHTLSFAVGEGARYAATHGQGCTYTGNSCSVTVANVAQQIAAAGVGLAPGRLNITLASTAGSITCNPLNSCYSNGAVWPPSGANTYGSAISVSGYYPAPPLLFIFLPSIGSVLNFSAVTLAASSQQIIEF